MYPYVFTNQFEQIINLGYLISKLIVTLIMKNMYCLKDVESWCSQLLMIGIVDCAQTKMFLKRRLRLFPQRPHCLIFDP